MGITHLLLDERFAINRKANGLEARILVQDKKVDVACKWVPSKE
jgi:hypothetical protein